MFYFLSIKQRFFDSQNFALTGRDWKNNKEILDTGLVSHFGNSRSNMFAYLQLVRNYGDDFVQLRVCNYMITRRSCIHKTLQYQTLRRELNALLT